MAQLWSPRVRWCGTSGEAVMKKNDRAGFWAALEGQRPVSAPAPASTPAAAQSAAWGQPSSHQPAVQQSLLQPEQQQEPVQRQEPHLDNLDARQEPVLETVAPAAEAASHADSSAPEQGWRRESESNQSQAHDSQAQAASVSGAEAGAVLATAALGLISAAQSPAAEPAIKLMMV